MDDSLLETKQVKLLLTKELHRRLQYESYLLEQSMSSIGEEILRRHFGLTLLSEKDKEAA